MPSGLPTLASLPPGGRPVPCRVRVVSGIDAGLERPVPNEGLVVGSDAICALRLRDPKVSRQHLRIEPGPHGFLVRDLGSTNGTYLDGNLIDSAVARVGADLRLGDEVLRLLPAEEPLLLESWPEDRLGDLVGSSLVMRELFAMIDRVATTDSPVLLHGETGTGKDLVARAIHQRSSRRNRELVTVDCGAIPESLIESEIFGHVRGAFTGALEARQGAFLSADGGTLFLDEIGDLPLALQPRFLRALEAGEVRPVGGDVTRRVDARVIAASHHDLSRLVEEGRFRADLYYRLAVVCLRIPPLRKRIEDLPLLAANLLASLGAPVSDEIGGPNLTRLAGYAWPGNVRELRNVLERAVAMRGRQGPCRFADLPLSLGTAPAARITLGIDFSIPYREARQQLLTNFERTYVRGLLESCGGKVSEAARISGLSRKSLYQLMKRHGIGR